MGNCGIPTLTCVLLLLFMAALYASATLRSHDEDASYEIMAVEDSKGAENSDHMGLRIIRSPSKKQKSKNKRKKLESPDTDNASSSGRRKGNKSEKRKHKPSGGRNRPGPDEGKWRPRPKGNKDGLLPGISRQMMRLAGKVYRASTPFAARLLAVLAAPPHDLVISPFSVHTALTMVMLGARGATEREMSTALGHHGAGLRKKKPHLAYQGLMSSLYSVQVVSPVYTANGVFVRPGIPLEDTFRQGLVQMYNATFNNFEINHPQGPEVPINNWVSNVTRDKISNLLARGTVTPLTKMILVNAIYLNASWSKPFRPEATRPGQFTTMSRGTQTVDMMRNTGFYNYANHHDTEVVELPYQGDRLAMYILLPNQSSNITHLQHQLSDTQRLGASAVERMFEGLKSEYLNFSMPKFRIDKASIDLISPLQKMGIQKAFDGGQADFSGISSSASFHISGVVHKAFISVSEHGTEAAAATAVIIGMSAIRDAPKEVKVDRPFVFIIRDMTMKTILFAGFYVGEN